MGSRSARRRRSSHSGTARRAGGPAGIGPEPVGRLVEGREAAGGGGRGAAGRRPTAVGRSLFAALESDLHRVLAALDADGPPGARPPSPGLGRLIAALAVGGGDVPFVAVPGSPRS